MDRETLVTVRAFTAALKRRIRVQLLILFGSRARGDNFVTSDYDFVVVSDDFDGIPFVRRASGLFRVWNSKRDLDVLCYTGLEWTELKDRRVILLNAQRVGVAVLGRRRPMSP